MFLPDDNLIINLVGFSILILPIFWIVDERSPA